MLFNCSVEAAEQFNRAQYDKDDQIIFANISNVVNGTDYENTFGSTKGSFGYNPPNNLGPQGGNSYLLRSDLNGKNWVFSPNSHLIF